ncbi:hypothetical protein [Leptolyngbya sp. Heron Island J]|uniref:hypothetical protein n=1 Tax=Leptolyngbya sp. Heron Island J TaxID=1385935 RepID=UPI003FA3AB0B
MAEKAGISAASFFKRFSTKQPLFVAAIGILEAIYLESGLLQQSFYVIIGIDSVISLTSIR